MSQSSNQGSESGGARRLAAHRSSVPGKGQGGEIQTYQRRCDRLKELRRDWKAAPTLTQRVLRQL